MTEPRTAIVETAPISITCGRCEAAPYAECGDDEGNNLPKLHQTRIHDAAKLTREASRAARAS